jgi:hypothetical protein
MHACALSTSDIGLCGYAELGESQDGKGFAGFASALAMPWRSHSECFALDHARRVTTRRDYPIGKSNLDDVLGPQFTREVFQA